jgi:hypothetical protein
LVQSDSSSSSNESDIDDSIQQMEVTRTPSCAVRRVTSSVTSMSNCPDDSIDQDSYRKIMEKKYFVSLSIAHERLIKMMKSLFENQNEIQKALRKCQVRIQMSFIERAGKNNRSNRNLIVLMEVIFSQFTLDQRLSRSSK